jgi:hypothetical protein
MPVDHVNDVLGAIAVGLWASSLNRVGVLASSWDGAGGGCPPPNVALAIAFVGAASSVVGASRGNLRDDRSASDGRAALRVGHATTVGARASARLIIAVRRLPNQSSTIPFDAEALETEAETAFGRRQPRAEGGEG